MLFNLNISRWLNSFHRNRPKESGTKEYIACLWISNLNIFVFCTYTWLYTLVDVIVANNAFLIYQIHRNCSVLILMVFLTLLPYCVLPLLSYYSFLLTQFLPWWRALFMVESMLLITIRNNEMSKCSKEKVAT